jgi:hypothetical protein
MTRERSGSGLRGRRRIAGAALAAACLTGAANLGAAEATAFLADQVVRGPFQAAGPRWKLGDREVNPADASALAVDSVSSRQAECGVRFTDGSFLVGRFPDFSAGQENAFESESFGPFKVAPDRPAVLYVGGPPGQYPEPESAGTAGVLLRTGEFVAGEILYVSARFAGLRVGERIRKFSLAPVYAVILRPPAAAEAPGPWRVRTLNGDVLFGEAAEAGFRLQVLGEARPLPLERVASAQRHAQGLLASAKVLEPGCGRRFRNGEGLPLQLASRRVVPEGLWQHAPSTLSLSPPPGSKALLFRLWREPGFFKGQIGIRFCAGAETLKELTLEPTAGVLAGAVPLPPAAGEVRVMVLAGGDEAYGDRIIWEDLVVAR